MGNCQTSVYCCGQNDQTENMGINGESQSQVSTLRIALWILQPSEWKFSVANCVYLPETIQLSKPV